MDQAKYPSYYGKSRVQYYLTIPSYNHISYKIFGLESNYVLNSAIEDDDMVKIDQTSGSK